MWYSSLVGSYIGAQGSFNQPAGALTWLYGLQRVKRELFPMARISSASMDKHWLSPPLLPYPSCARATGVAARMAAPKEVSDFIILTELREEENGD